MCAVSKRRALVFAHMSPPHSGGSSLSLMCFPCVLERQTQLHFNDTQTLLGSRIHVYVFDFFFVVFFFFLLKSVCSFRTTSAPDGYPPPRSEKSWEDREELSGVPRQTCLPLNGLSAQSLSSPLLKPPLLLSNACTHINAHDTQPPPPHSPEEMGPTVSFE